MNPCLRSVRSVVRVYPGPFCGTPCPMWLFSRVGLSSSCLTPLWVVKTPSALTSKRSLALENVTLRRQLMASWVNTQPRVKSCA